MHVKVAVHPHSDVRRTWCWCIGYLLSTHPVHLQSLYWPHRSGCCSVVESNTNCVIRFTGWIWWAWRLWPPALWQFVLYPGRDAVPDWEWVRAALLTCGCSGLAV
jgi:hypothetical protein